jgi:predicted ATPase
VSRRRGHQSLPPLKSEIIPNISSFTGEKVAFINRVAELEDLKNAIERILIEKGGLFFICGEAGIGKTRLANEVVSYAGHKKIDVLYSSCPLFFKKSGVPPYSLWKQIIRDYFSDINLNQFRKSLGDYQAEVCKLVPEIKNKLGRISESVMMSPELEKDRLNEAVSQFIVNISENRPIIIILDDLQWADSS